ncbi:hypothetical protein S2091_2798 [Solimicrobium silvestre]|uniref:Uncharacterized protein n=2 Tax=Solimicrobium silvestre TaxID=2099400 RepID=A0A2S9GXI6_9BURK|nr:hypothetical protein S2091_2798 [Solimicrobium silvestre]
MPNSRRFEYRLTTSQLHEPQNKHVLRLVYGLIIVAFAALFYLIFQKIGIENLDAYQVVKKTADNVLHNPAVLFKFATYSPYIHLIFYLFILVTVNWWVYILPTSYSLTLTDDELISNHQLPFGLNALIPAISPFNWHISLHDITAVELIQIPLFGKAMQRLTTPTFAFVRLRISQRSGPVRTINPAMWVVPGSLGRTPLKPVGKRDLLADFFSNVANRWLKPENQAILRAGLLDLPIAHALSERGVTMSEAAPHNIKEHDLFACRSIKFGIITALTLSSAALGILLLCKYQHLKFDFPLSLHLLICTTILCAFFLLNQNDKSRPPLLHTVLTALCLVGSMAIGAQPIAMFLNGFGVTSNQSQDFVIRAGKLEPIANFSGIGSIKLPGKESRQGWLQSGTKVTLKVTQGHFGLWEYNDEPLRQLVDAQGIE